MIHHEPHRTLDAAANHQRIDEAHVVTYQHTRAFIGNVGQALFLDAVKRVNEHPDDEAHQEFWHQLKDEQRNSRVHDAHDQVKLR